MAKPIGQVDIQVSAEQARRFLLAHHRLLPPRKLAGKQAALEYVRHVNCIQYDPINVVGQNPHLVLQSRVRNYKPSILNELLYEDRNLVDGFDKVMSIYPKEDWPFFAGTRSQRGQHLRKNEEAKIIKLLDWVAKEIEERGPLSSIDLEEETRVQSWFGNATRASRIALDILFFSGEIVVHHRVGTRRYFELSHRLLSKKLHGAPDPHPTADTYKDWHVLRRVRGVGIARPNGNDQWVGILRKSSEATAEIQRSLARLVGRGEVVRVGIEGFSNQVFYVQEADLALLKASAKPLRTKPGMAFIAPLDNFMWDRNLIEALFGFYYRWEVYVPEPQRVYAYYVLPVLYGEKLVARIDPSYDRTTKTFTINNWWWEKGIDKKDPAMLSAAGDCIAAFMKYLGAEKTVLGLKIKKDTGLKAAVAAANR